MSRKPKSQPLLMEHDIISKESHQRSKQEIKLKGISEEPHPKDRESGTGRGKEMRKNGVGKHNWGTYKDDLKDYGLDDLENFEEKKKQEIIPKRKNQQVEIQLVLDEVNFPQLN